MFFFFFLCNGAHRVLHVLTHSVPTRRSSDLPLMRHRFGVANLCRKGYRWRLFLFGENIAQKLRRDPRCTEAARRARVTAFARAIFSENDRQSVSGKFKLLCGGQPVDVVQRTDRAKKCDFCGVNRRGKACFIEFIAFRQCFELDPVGSLNAHRHGVGVGGGRSEEHTSELQSLMRLSYAVFCLKKKKTSKSTNN